MARKEYQYISSNTLHALALHDCTIEHSTLNNGTLVFYFDHIDVLPDHPHNPYPVAKCTGEASLIFHDVVVQQSSVYDTSEYNGVLAAREQAKLILLPIICSPYKFIILHCTCVSNEKKRNVYRFNGDLWTPNKRCGAGLDCLTIQFSEVFVCWNELEKDSWFENFPKS